MLYLLLPLIDAALLALVAFLAMRWFFRKEKLMPIIAKVMNSLEEQLQRKLEAADINMEVDSLLEQRLDAILLSLKQQIPMASMLLSGALADKFKGQAKGEILKMLPGLKERLLERLSKEINLKEWVLGQVQELASKKLALRCIVYAALIGFLMGLINGVIILIFR